MLKTISKNDTEAGEALAKLKLVEQHLARLVDDKAEVIDVTLCALLSGGHVLLEDVPGVGKTTFIKALAKLLGQDMTRIQFTSDLLPADIIGVEVFDTSAGEFVFHRGPLFTRILLADELNRASPRTQSALLEAMGEGQVTEGRRSYELPKPFIVFASQNPNDSAGTYELPESQLDRFAAKIKMGYPTTRREMEILQAASNDPLRGVPIGVLTLDELASFSSGLDGVHVSDKVASYAKRILDASRASDKLRVGISTRGGVIWVRMAKAKALLAGRSYVIPDDLQALATSCLAHRVLAQANGSADAAIKDLIARVDVG